MAFTEETARQYVRGILLKNGFIEQERDLYRKGVNVMVTVKEDHYVVSYYDVNFLEWMDWFSPDKTIYSLLGYLSFYGFIKRGYEL